MARTYGATNPRAEPDSRFDPVANLDNAIAHADPDAFDQPDTESETDVQAVVRTSLERALLHYKEHLEQHQKDATDYYHGRPFGDEEEGRSKVVSTDVRDATQAQLPSLMRVFFGPERAVEFRPRGPEDEAVARQSTEYVNYVVSEDNDGYLIHYSAFKDALVRNLGVFKWWWDESGRVEAANYSGLDLEGVLALINEEGAEAVSITSVVQGPEGPTFAARVVRQQVGGRARYAAVPPEEFVFTPGARDLETAPLVAHVREVAAEELVQLGVDPDLIDAAKGKTSLDSDDLRHARQHDEGLGLDDEDSLDESQRPVLYAEAYCLVDADGDGVAELRLFRCIGSDFEITNGDGLGEIVDEVPFAVLTPDPEPHTIVGLGNFDLLKDVQRVKSQILRETLNSLAKAVDPDTEVVEHQVNMSDVLSTEASKVVRVRAPGMIREVGHQFVGGATLTMLQYYDEIKENRTGQSKAAQGLDADSLQSATKAAVAATLTAAQQRVEMIARNFAETGVKRLYKGLLRLVVRHQDRARTVRLRGQWVQVDPRHWDATMDVQVNVALGQGTTEEKIQLLAGILGIQKELMQTGSPLVSNVELRSTLGRAVELAGFRNSDEFFRPWGPEQEQQAQQMAAQQPPPPDPNMMLVQIEQQKAQADAQIQMVKAQAAQQEATAKLELERARFELERWKAIAQDDRERDKVARDTVLKEQKIEAEFVTDIVDADLQKQIADDRAQMDR